MVTVPESAGIDERAGRQSLNRFPGLLQIEARTASVTGRLENYRRVKVRVKEALQLPEVFLRYRRISHRSSDGTAVHLEGYGCIHTTNRINSRLNGLLPGKGKIINIFYIFT